MGKPSLPVVIVGGGFTGLSAAWELSKQGIPVELYEADSELGGLAGTFEIQPGVRVEKFYHHWFTSDRDALRLIEELGLSGQMKRVGSCTGLYYANTIFRLSSPLDLLGFKPIPFLDRLRTGLMALWARRVRNWKPLEEILAKDWILKVGGRAGYEVIWQPLLRGKFGPEADHVSAVWFWNKLKLRGGSRGDDNKEQLLYLEGSFGSAISEMQRALESRGVVIHTASPVKQIVSENRVIQGVLTAEGLVRASAVLATVPLPVFLQLTPELPSEYRKKCQHIRFLGNVCLVLRLRRSLSDTYWLNVADPSFPFVGIIEHTNFDAPSNYGGERIAYVSKYLPTSDELFGKSDEEFFRYCLPYIKRMFPAFSEDWVIGYKLWRAQYSQPVITRNYSSYVPGRHTTVKHLYLATMAQIYPEDRGTNYAVREGREAAQLILQALQSDQPARAEEP